MATHEQFYSREVIPTNFQTITTEQTSFELSDSDQRIPGNHTTPCIVFPLSSQNASKDEIIDHLSKGLQNVLEHIPLIGGRLKNTSEHLSVVRLDKEPIKLNVHDLSSDISCPTYEALANNGFDPDFFSKNSSRLTPPDSNLAGFRRDDGCPVAVFQANFIRGGLILTIALHHVCGDAKSIDHVFSLWAASSKAAAEGIPMPIWEPSLNRSYFNASFTPNNEEILELKEKVRGVSFHPINKSETGPLTDPPTPPETSLKMYHFSAASCAKLKDICRPNEPGKFVSSYDCIAALTWRSMTRARVPYLKMDLENTETNYAHPVDTRGRFGQAVPKDYFGNGFIMAVSKSFTVGELLGEGNLKKVAQAIRQSTLNVNKNSIPDLVNVRKGIEGKEEMRWIWHPQNVVGTSWTGMQVFQKYDFGFGLPVSIRLPVPPFEGTLGVLPASTVEGKSDGFDVYVVLEKSCQERLQVDPEYRAYCSLLG